MCVIAQRMIEQRLHTHALCMFPCIITILIVGITLMASKSVDHWSITCRVLAHACLNQGICSCFPVIYSPTAELTGLA